MLVAYARSAGIVVSADNAIPMSGKRSLAVLGSAIRNNARIAVRSS